MAVPKITDPNFNYFDYKFNNYNNSRYNDGEDQSNGLSGFKNWECYMLLKYGHKNNFTKSDNLQYLIELPLYPEQVTESISASWQTQSILGRSSPLAAYAGTDLKRVNFELELHRDFLTGSYSLTNSALSNAGGSLSRQAAGLQKQSGRGPFDTRTWYVNVNKMLQMACYPQYTTAGLIPPTVYFIFGQMILKGFVENYSTSWKKPIINTFYGWNTVSIQMSCYPDEILTAHEMITGDGAMSTQNTYNTKYPTRDATSSDVMNRQDILGDNVRSNLRTGNTLGGGVRDT